MNATVSPYEVHAINLKKAKSLLDRIEDIKKAIGEEIDNLMAPGLMEVTIIDLIAPIHWRDIIKLWLFHKENKDANGVL